MPEREVTQGMTTYTDETGVLRYAVAGETVTVHPDHVERFDRLNGSAPEEDTPAPKKRPARKR